MSENDLIRLIELSMDTYRHNDFEIGSTGSYFRVLRDELSDYIIIEQCNEVKEELAGVEVTWKPVREHYLFMGIRVVNMGGTSNGYVVTEKGVLP